MLAISRVAFHVVCTILALTCLGCVSNVVIGAPGDPDADLFLTGFQFDGILKPHFGGDPDVCGLRHLRGQPNASGAAWASTGNARIRESDWVWMVAGEGLCAYWTMLAQTTEPAGQPGQSTTCDYCSFPAAGQGGCPSMRGSGLSGSAEFGAVGTGLEVRVYAWPLPIFDVRERVAEFGWGTGCTTPSRPDEPPTSFPEHRPEGNARFQLATFPHGAASDAETSLAVVWRESFGVILAPAGGAEMEMPPRLLEPDPAHPGRYTWQVKTIDGGKLDENFSPNLRVARIRVARFKVVAGRAPDSVGRHQDYVLTKVEDLVPPYVPTNVQFLAHRCVYPPMSTADSIPIAECVTGSGRDLVTATPVFEISLPAQGVTSVISDPISWEINYEAGGGFAVPTLAADERLGVIFVLTSVR